MNQRRPDLLAQQWNPQGLVQQIQDLRKLVNELQKQPSNSSSSAAATNAATNVPIGGGVWWWGTLALLPNGWKLVDGTVAVNGSTPPDMRNRMPIGAGTTYALGATGGASSVNTTDENAHTHSATAGATSSDFGALAWLASQPSGPGSAHHHTVATLPPYAAWYFIVRVQ